MVRRRRLHPTGPSGGWPVSPPSPADSHPAQGPAPRRVVGRRCRPRRRPGDRTEARPRWSAARGPGWTGVRGSRSCPAPWPRWSAVSWPRLPWGSSASGWPTRPMPCPSGGSRTRRSNDRRCGTGSVPPPPCSSWPRPAPWPADDRGAAPRGAAASLTGRLCGWRPAARCARSSTACWRWWPPPSWPSPPPTRPTPCPPPGSRAPRSRPAPFASRWRSPRRWPCCGGRGRSSTVAGGARPGPWSASRTKGPRPGTSSSPRIRAHRRRHGPPSCWWTTAAPGRDRR